MQRPGHPPARQAPGLPGRLEAGRSRRCTGRRCCGLDVQACVEKTFSDTPIKLIRHSIATDASRSGMPGRKPASSLCRNDWAGGEVMMHSCQTAVRCVTIVDRHRGGLSGAAGTVPPAAPRHSPPASRQPPSAAAAGAGSGQVRSGQVGRRAGHSRLDQAAGLAGGRLSGGRLRQRSVRRPACRGPDRRFPGCRGRRSLLAPASPAPCRAWPASGQAVAVESVLRGRRARQFAS